MVVGSIYNPSYTGKSIVCEQHVSYSGRLSLYAWFQSLLTNVLSNAARVHANSVHQLWPI